MQKTLFIILSLCTTCILWAQDPQFSQFYANPIYTNPAFAGASNNIRVGLIGRMQYTNIPNAYTTAAAAIDAPITSLNGGLGIMATTDIAGDGKLTTNTVSLIYAYNTKLTRKLYMRAGVQAQMYQRTYDFSKFKFGDQIDPQFGFILPTAERRGIEQVTKPNFAAGVLLYSDRFFGGFASHNLAEPNHSFYNDKSSEAQFKLPRRYTVHAGANIPLTESRYDDQRVYISPNVLFMQQRNFNQLNLGFYVKKNALTAGMWFRQTSRNTDAVIILVGLKFPKFRIGYSYDQVVSGLGTAAIGSHEVSLAFEIKPPKKSEKKVKKAMRCPEF
jgi:type IX secretion system PorP/SprF family membrane protein